MGATRPRRARVWLPVLAIVLVGIIAAAWLQTEPREPVPAYAAQDVTIIAHAGAQGHAPPNTMEAFEAALELGAHVLEMDLQVTADGRIVTIHDGTVDRTTDGSGPVSEFTLEELQSLDAGYTWQDEDGNTPFRGQGVRHAALSEVFEAFPDTHLIIELKTDGGEAIIQPTIDLIVEYDRVDRVTVASFNRDYLRPVREQLPRVPTNMPEAEAQTFYVLHRLGLHPWWTPPGELFQVPEFWDANLYGIQIDDLRVVSPGFVRAAERLGIETQVWTINEVEDMHRMLDHGAHAILTDHPDRMVEVLAEREAERGYARGPDPSRYDPQLDRAARLQDQAAWLTPVWSVITFLGEEDFYLLIFPLLYWAVSRRLGIRLGVMMMISAGLNGLLKLVFTTPRPSFLDPSLDLAHETSFGLPSGHAQNAAAIWGVLAASLRNWPARVALIALIALIGWSRIHLGVHFLEDMLTGWLVGAVLVVLYLWLAPRTKRWAARLPLWQQILGAVTASLMFIAPATLLSGRLTNVSFPWPGMADPAAATGVSGIITPTAGLAGFASGIALIQAKGGFDHRGPIGRRLLRVLVGLVGVVVLWQGLGAVFPGGEDPLALVLRYVRYGLVGVWVSGFAPLLFRRFGLADAAPIEGEAEDVAVGADRGDG